MSNMLVFLLAKKKMNSISNKTQVDQFTVAKRQIKL